MLQGLREKTTGWIATVILGLLIIPFAFFGIEQYSSTGPDATAVAKIDTPPKYWQSAPHFWPFTLLYDKHEVTVEEYRSRLEQLRAEQRQQQGDAFDALEFDKPENKRALAERLIDEKVGAIAAQQERLAVSDAEVQKEIAAIPAFQVNGKFDPQTYVMTLRSIQPAQTPKQFETTIRQNLEQRILPAGIANSSFITPKELNNLVKLSGETRDVTVIGIPSTPDMKAAVSDAEVTKWYNEHKGQLQSPETVVLEYVVIDAAKLPPPTPVSEQAIREQYDKDIAKYTGTESREASHILVEVPANANKAAQDAAKARVDKIYTEVTASGADFGAIAKAQSDDSGSKAQGGNLGAISKGSMPKAFEDAVFAMQANQISKPVKTEFGWHIIRVGKVNTASQRTFDQVKGEIAAELNKKNASQQINNVTGKILDAVYRNPTDLQGPAKANGLTVETTEPLARTSNEGLFAVQGVKREAFKESNIKEGTVSEPIDMSPTQKVLLRVVKHSPAAAIPLAQVKDRVIQQIRVDRANAAALEKANAALAKIKAGTAFDAATTGYPRQNLTAVPRQSRELDPKLGEAIFGISSSAKGAAQSRVVQMTNGQPLVIQVNKVTPGNPSAYTPAQMQQLMQQFSLGRGIDEVNSFIKAKRRTMKVRVLDANL